MIDLYLLEELVAFKKYKTLAKTAETLSVTQPTVTRGMQKLENELGTSLFKREPNRITLNKTGEFAATEAEKVIQYNQNYAKRIQKFALSENSISVVANAPGPLILLESLKNTNIKIDSRLISANYHNLILNGQYTCIFLNRPLKHDKIDSIYLGTENLSVHLNKFSNLASQHEINFSELKNMTFLVLQDIGIWQEVIQKHIPNAKFLYQENRNNFTEIRNNSIFPYFTTNLTPSIPAQEQAVLNDRIPVKIADQSAHQQFYACFLKENKNRLQPLIDQMQDQWTKVDN